MMAAWNFAVNLASPFLTVYMLRSLAFPMSTVVILNVISQLSNLAFLQVWGKLGDILNPKRLITVALCFSMLGTLVALFSVSTTMLIVARAIQGVGSVPNPLQTDYNISPANLEALYNATLKQTGLPPSEVLPNLPAPTNI